MYPEGTRSHQTDASLLPFKKGAFHLAVQGQMPLIPIVASTYAPTYSESRMVFEPALITIQVLDPIPTVGLGPEDVSELCERTRSVMLTALQSLKTQPLTVSVESLLQETEPSTNEESGLSPIPSATPPLYQRRKPRAGSLTEEQDSWKRQTL